MIKIAYPGTGNYSAFTFDGLGQRVQIAEYTSGTLSSTKQFVWSGGTKPKEARNSSGTITAQYFGRGEIISGTDYFFTLDHLGSVREMTNSSGAIVDQLAYDPYGRPTTLQGGSTAPDFQFAGYYLHAPSGLLLTATRSYNTGLGRFIQRDPSGINGGVNLYGYVGNSPAIGTDPSGLDGAGATIGAAIGAALGALGGALAGSLAEPGGGTIVGGGLGWQQGATAGGAIGTVWGAGQNTGLGSGGGSFGGGFGSGWVWPGGGGGITIGPIVVPLPPYVVPGNGINPDWNKPNPTNPAPGGHCKNSPQNPNDSGNPDGGNSLPDPVKDTGAAPGTGTPRATTGSGGVGDMAGPAPNGQLPPQDDPYFRVWNIIYSLNNSFYP